MSNTPQRNSYGDMTTGTIWKSLLVFALPIMLGLLLQQLYATVDGIVVGNFVSDGALAAVGNCSIVTNIFLAFATGMSGGSSVVVSQLFGAGKREDMRKAASSAIFLLLMLGLAAMIIVFLSSGFAVKHILAIQEADIRAEATTYLRIYSLGMLFTFLYNVVAYILRAVGDSRAVLYFLVVSTVMNTLLDLLFVAVLGWGVAGAAWATIISQFACVAVSVWYMYRRYADFRFRLKEIRPDGEKLKMCLKMGIPTTMQQLVVFCGQLFLQRLINSFGKITMAAWAVGVRYDSYCSIPALGMSQAMSGFSGQNTGAGRLDRVKKGLATALIMDFIIVTLIGVNIHTFASPLASLFGVEGESLKQATECIRYLSLCYCFFSIYMPFHGMFQGVGDANASAVASILALVVRVSGSYILVYVFDWGYKAIWTPYIVGWGVAFIYCLVRFFRGKWRSKSLVRESDCPPALTTSQRPCRICRRGSSSRSYDHDCCR